MVETRYKCNLLMLNSGLYSEPIALMDRLLTATQTFGTDSYNLSVFERMIVYPEIQSFCSLNIYLPIKKGRI